MQGLVEALNIHIAGNINPSQQWNSHPEYLNQVLKELNTPASLADAVTHRNHNSIRK